MSGIVLVVIACSCIFYSIDTLFLLGVVVNFIGLWEYTGLINKHREHQNERVRTEKFIIGCIGTVLYCIVGGVLLGRLGSTSYLSLILPILLLMFLKELFAGHPKMLIRLAFNVTGLLYIALPMGLFNGVAIMNGSFQPLLVFSFITLVSLNDIFAYFSGKRFGKHKLAPVISPKKTWEGSIGGAAGVLVFAFLFALFFPQYSLLIWLGMAVIVIVFGGLGDLVESMLKRSVGAKDSGTILPGHGGVLDRIDAMLFALPFLFAYLHFVL